MEFWFILSLISAVGFGVLAVLWKVIMEELSPPVTLAYLFPLSFILRKACFSKQEYSVPVDSFCFNWCSCKFGCF